LPGLDGLRMVAVFLVVFYHLGFPTASGGHGVLIFFVLSGFLITWLLLKEQEQFGSISLRLLPPAGSANFSCVLLLLAALDGGPTPV